MKINYFKNTITGSVQKYAQLHGFHLGPSILGPLGRTQYIGSEVSYT